MRGPLRRRLRARVGQGRDGDVHEVRHVGALVAGPARRATRPTLGGGIGWLSRRHGLACNSVHAIELVSADGALRRVDRAHEPDLFWALRGEGAASAS